MSFRILNGRYGDLSNTINKLKAKDREKKMKVFKKWVAKKQLGIYVPDNYERIWLESRYAESWKAALEQVLNWMSENTCRRNLELEDMIKEELEVYER